MLGHEMPVSVKKGMTSKEELWKRSNCLATDSTLALDTRMMLSMGQVLPVGVAMALMRVAVVAVHHRAAPSKISISPPGLRYPAVWASAGNPGLMRSSRQNQNQFRYQNDQSQSYHACGAMAQHQSPPPCESVRTIPIPMAIPIPMVEL